MAVMRMENTHRRESQQRDDGLQLQPTVRGASWVIGCRSTSGAVWSVRGLAPNPAAAGGMETGD